MKKHIMLVPVPEFNDIKQFNSQLLMQCDEDMQREHYKKDLLINDLFEEDKRAMKVIEICSERTNGKSRCIHCFNFR